MPCCGILLRHFALYINLSQHRWADFFLLWADDGAKRAPGWALPRAAVSLSKQAPKAGLGHPAVVWLLPRAAPQIADPMLFPAQAAPFQHP